MKSISIQPYNINPFWVKKMDNGERKTAKLAVAILTILLLSSMAMLLNSSNTATAQDYGDIMQYDWPQAGSDEGNSGFNAGPAPDHPDVLWKAPVSGGMVTVFDGKTFTTSGNTLICLDAFTGNEIYQTSAPGTTSASSGNAVQKLDDTYLLVTGSSGCTGRRIATGEAVWESETPNANRQSGSGTYFGGHYSTSMKMFFNHAYDPVAHQAQIVAHDVSDPSVEAPIAWVYPCDTPGELLCSGDGLVYVGSTEGKVYRQRT